MKEGFASVLLLLGQCQVNRTLSPQNPGSAMWPLDLLNTCESQPHAGKRNSPIWVCQQRTKRPRWPWNVVALVQDNDLALRQTSTQYQNANYFLLCKTPVPAQNWSAPFGISGQHWLRTPEWKAGNRDRETPHLAGLALLSTTQLLFLRLIIK